MTQSCFLEISSSLLPLLKRHLPLLLHTDKHQCFKSPKLRNIWDDFQNSKIQVQNLIKKADENFRALKTEAERNIYKKDIMQSKDILEGLLVPLPSKNDQEQYENKVKDIFCEYHKLVCLLFSLSLQIVNEKNDEITRCNRTLTSNVENIQNQMKHAEEYYKTLLYHKDQEIWQMNSCMSSEYMQWNESYQKERVQYHQELQKLHFYYAECANKNYVIENEFKKAKEELIKQKVMYVKLKEEYKQEVDVLNKKFNKKADEMQTKWLKKLEGLQDMMNKEKKEYKIVNDNLEAELSFYTEAYKQFTLEKEEYRIANDNLEAELSFYMEAYETCSIDLQKRIDGELDEYKNENRKLEADLSFCMQAHMEAHIEATKLKEDLSQYMKICEEVSITEKKVDKESDNESDNESDLRVAEDPYQNIYEDGDKETLVWKMRSDIPESPKKKIKRGSYIAG